MIKLFNYLPEFLLTLHSLFIFLFIINCKKSSDNFTNFNIHNIVSLSCFLVLFVVFFLFCLSHDLGHNYSTEDIFISSKGGNILKKFIVFFSILALVPITYSFNLQKLSHFEFYPLYLMSIVSSLLLINACDFLSVYLVLEIQALCFYILTTLRKNSVFSITAGLKYYIFGSIASCLLLFALSFLYGSLGTLHFYKLYLIMYSFPLSNELFVALHKLILLCLFAISVVLLFKLGIAPFHFWLPDVYEGAPLGTTIILSILPKLAIFDLFIRISKVFGQTFKELEILFVIAGVLSILLGSISALNQTRLKRFFIFSSVSLMGFPTMLLSCNNLEWASSIYFFIIFYTIVSILMWTIYTIIYKFSGKSYISNNIKKSLPIYITDLSNVHLIDNNLCAFFLLIFFSAASIPPLPGFFIKMLALLELVKSSSFMLCSIIILFLSIVSTFYYIRFIKILFFETKNDSDLNRLHLFNDETNNFMLKLNVIVASICLFLIIHSFFFIDTWLLLSQYIYLNIVP